MKRSVLFALVTVAFCTVGTQNAMAESNFGLQKLGVAVGFVSPEDLDGTISIGALADLGTLSPKFGMEAHLDRWSQSEEAFGTEASVSDLTLGMRGKYLFPVSNPKIQPFAGAGLGIHFLHAEVSVPAMGPIPGMSVDDSSTELGLELGGGMTTNLSPRTDLRTELWYGFSDVDQFSMRVGMAWQLGN
jgi:opacity protein-like surface antigen